MIVVKLKGGLGNQMFQYAAARRLAHRLGAELKLDLSFLNGSQEGCTPRSFQLGELNIAAAIASAEEIAWITRPVRSRMELFRLRLGSALGLHGAPPTQVRERHFHFDPQLLDAPDNSHLEGYWQSEKYFADIAGILRAEFACTSPLSGKNLEVAEQVRACNSVSVHLRRGDYVTSRVASETHGLCGADYYRSCIEELAQTVPELHLFVFSDEPQRAREELETGLPTVIVDHNGPERAGEDLRLMSLCRHNVIANSSFSWWGAWLNENLDKKVFAPGAWFRDDSYHTDDLLPPAWLQR